jgi:hypothetical protein
MKRIRLVIGVIIGVVSTAAASALFRGAPCTSNTPRLVQTPLDTEPERNR